MFFFIVKVFFVSPLLIANHIFSPFSSTNLIFPPSLNSPLVISVNSVPAFASNGMNTLYFSVFKIFFPVTIISPVPDNAFTGRFEESSIIIVFPDAFFIIAGALFPISSFSLATPSLFICICSRSAIISCAAPRTACTCFSPSAETFPAWVVPSVCTALIASVFAVSTALVAVPCAALTDSTASFPAVCTRSVCACPALFTSARACCAFKAKSPTSLSTSALASSTARTAFSAE